MKNAIELKGSVLSMSVLKVFSNEIDAIKQELTSKIEMAPGFFTGLPVVIEPQIDPLEPTLFALLVEFLHQKQLIPIGVRTADEAVKTQAEYAGLAVFDISADKAKDAAKPQATEDSSAQTTEQVASEGMVYQGAVRSGQQLYAKGRDLIIKGVVNPGAEVVADGHVQVFGAVKGKVFAGACGNQDARIFANNLDAEMVCIAGLYQMAEDIKPEFKTGMVEIKLEKDKLVFSKLA